MNFWIFIMLTSIQLKVRLLCTQIVINKIVNRLNEFDEMKRIIKLIKLV